MLILCELCNFRGESYKEWMTHLFSNGHQTQLQSTIWEWPNRRNERSFAVLNYMKDKDLPAPDLKKEYEAVAWHYSQYSLVSDYFVKPEQGYCIIEVDTREAVVQLLTMEHQLGPYTLKLRCKTEFTNTANPTKYEEGIEDEEPIKTESGAISSQPSSLRYVDSMNLKDEPRPRPTHPLAQAQTSSSRGSAVISAPPIPSKPLAPGGKMRMTDVFRATDASGKVIPVCLACHQAGHVAKYCRNKTNPCEACHRPGADRSGFCVSCTSRGLIPRKRFRH